MIWTDLLLRPRLLAVLLLCPLLAAASAASDPSGSDPDWIAGSWHGRLSAGGQEILVVYHFDVAPDGALAGTMDVPSQGALGIPLSDLVREGSTVSMKFPSPGGGAFRGTRDGDVIRGEFSQGPATIPLELSRGNGADAGPARPQRPEPPFPYRTEDVRFTNAEDGTELAGTVTLPEGPGPHAGVVLLSGATAQPRDGSLFGHPTMLVLADYLTRNGTAVLRFDDRGAGQSGGDFDAADAADQAGDVEAAIERLAAFPGVVAGRVGVAAHSQGCVAATLVAERGDAAFLILLGGAGLPATESLEDQAKLAGRMAGLPASIVELNARLYRELARIALKEPDRERAAVAMRAALHEEVAALPVEARSLAEQLYGEPGVEATVHQFNSPSMRFLLAHDPREMLGHVTIPVLALFGGSDRQVECERHAPAVRAALERAGNRAATVECLPGLNHLFQESADGSPADYGRIEQTMAPAALERIAAWLARQ